MQRQCSNCATTHVSFFSPDNSLCSACLRANNLQNEALRREQRNLRKEQKLQNQALRNEKRKLREKQEQERAARRGTSQKSPEEKHRWRKIQMRARRIGITADELMTLEEQQNGICAICGTQSGQLHIDHCHRTNKVRALLCHSCNHLLGNARDSIDILEKAIAYLRGKNT